MIAPLSRPPISDAVGAQTAAARALPAILLWSVAAACKLTTAARRGFDRALAAGRESGGVRTPFFAALVLGVAVVGCDLWGVALPRPSVGSPLLFAAGMAVRGDPSDDIEHLADTVERLEDGEYDVDASTDRDDAVGRLYEAVDELAETLRERDRRRERSERYRRELYEITSDAELDDEEKVRRLLELGSERLEVENGLITRVDEETDRYEIETAVGSDFVETGAVSELSETFCRKTVSSDDILGIYDAAEAEWQDDPAHRVWGIGCYLGGKITVDGELYGTLCFVDRNSRSEPFSHEEKVFVDLMTRWVSYEFERRRRRRERRETNERLGAIIEASPAPIVAFDTDGRVELWNPAAEDTFGWSEAELLGEPLPIVPEERADEFEAFRERLLDGESLTGVETRRRTRGGDLIDVSFSAAPVRDDGDVIGVMAVLEDITERKRLESELREVLGRVTDAFYALDDDWTFEFVNERALERMAPGETDLVGETIWEAFPEREDATMGREFRRAMDEQTPVSFEEYSERLDAWFDIRAYPSETGLSVYFRDVTDRKRRERQLERTTARLEALFENSPDMLDVLDPEGRIVEANRRFCEKLGYDEEELVGTGIWKYERLFDADEVRSVLDDMSVGERRRFEGRFERRDGSTFPIEVHIIRLDLSDGDRFVAICRDIADRKERERELRETKRRLDLALEGTNTGVWEWNLETDEVEWNETFERMMGLEPGEFEGTFAAFARRVHPEDLPRVETETERAIENDELYRTEFRLRHEDGSWIWIGARGRLVEEDGERRMIGIDYDVTERKERERELRETKRRLDLALEGTNTGVWEWDMETDEVEWNETFERMVGLEPGEFEGTVAAFERRVHPDDYPRVEAEIERALENDELYQTEFRLRREDGEWIWVGARGRLVEEGGGQRMVGINNDITERKERERELRETKRRLDLALEGTNTGIWEWHTDTNELIWNETLERNLGLEPGEFEGTFEAFQRLVHSEDLPRVRESFERALETGEFDRTEIRFRRKDGTVIWAEARGKVVNDETDGDRVIGTHHEITDRKVAEQKLRERERDLRRYKDYTDDVLDAVDDVFYVLDEDGYNQRWNESLHEVTGYSPEEIDGMHALEFFAEEHRDRIEAAIEEVFESGDARVEAPFRTENGELVPYEFVASALEDPEGNPVVAGIGRDVSERVEYERELERIRYLLEQSQRIAGVGAWEVRAEGGDPVDLVWTDETYRIHDLSPETDLSLERALEFYHPDDRDRIREGVRGAIREGVGYDREARLITAEGDERWVRAIADPVRKAGEIVAVRGSIQDVTEQKDREAALAALHDAAQDLLTTDTDADAADLVVETAAEILDAAGAGIYLLDEETNRLQPAAGFGAFADAEMPAITAGDSDSLLWNCYVAGAPTVFDESESAEPPAEFVGDVSSGLLVPIGDHGVFVVATTGSAADDELRRLAETLVATAEAAFDRIESEASLRERDAELESRNRRLKRQIKINEIIRSIGQSLIGATGQDEIERTVCDRLADAEDVAFAWIGELSPGGDELVPRAWAGSAPEYLDAVSLAATGGASEPSVIAARTEAPAVVSNVLDRLKAEPWRKSALAHDFHSVLCVPLSYGDYVYGVLSVYAEEPDFFDDLERAVFRELGESIANSINAVNTQQALHADASLELTIRIEDSEALLLRIAREVGCRVEYRGIGSHSPDETVVFFTTDGGDPDAVEALLDDLVSVRDSRLISASDDGGLFKATVTGGAITPELLRHGASPRSMRADEERLELVAHAPTTTDVRQFVEMLRDQFPSAQLVGRRNVQRETQSRRDLVSSLLDELTERQLEVLRTAYFAGFFDWPRESTGEDVAEMLGVSQPTINRHLRIGQQRLMSQLFGPERAVEAE